MTNLDTAVQRLAQRLSVARLGLAQGGPVALLEVILAPVVNAIDEVIEQAIITEQPSFEPVDEAIGPATTSVLAEMWDPHAGEKHRFYEEN